MGEKEHTCVCRREDGTDCSNSRIEDHEVGVGEKPKKHAGTGVVGLDVKNS